jgi:hypothetical protein
MGCINTSPKLEKYKRHKGLNERLPNYCVKMGFGLHYGWAIEGAIGSAFKIDASYLSPNVNMASRLEAATKQFGVPLLVSGHLVALFTREMKNEVRHIDRVTVKGSIEPVDFYTCDVDFTKLTPNAEAVDLSLLTKTERKALRVQTKRKRNNLRNKVFSGERKTIWVFKGDPHISAMRSSFTSVSLTVALV